MWRNSVNAMSPRSLRALVAAVTLSAGLPAIAQQAYSTPEGAAEALGDAVARSDPAALTTVLGPRYHSLWPEGSVHRDDEYAFLSAWAKQHRIIPDGDKRAILSVGESGWTFPIPIVKTADGWKYDLVAGRKEILLRRLGRNELAAMDVLRQLAYAQERFAERVGDGRYAAKLVSTLGKTDGLYWPAAASPAPSPLDATALAMGPDTPPDEAFYGYHYRIIPPGPGSASKYAFIAWPANYGQSGVHTFELGSDKQLFERDLGPETASRAKAIKAFAPDGSWKRVTEEQ